MSVDFSQIENCAEIEEKESIMDEALILSLRENVKEADEEFLRQQYREY